MTQEESGTPQTTPNIGAKLRPGASAVAFMCRQADLIEADGHDVTASALREGIAAIAELERALSVMRGELEQWTKWGMIEVAIRNPNVNSWMNHWEDRALKAESALKREQGVAEARKQALGFAHAAISDAIMTEDGLDGDAGTGTLQIIVEAIEKGTFDREVCTAELEWQKSVVEFLESHDFESLGEASSYIKREQEAANKVREGTIEAVQAEPELPGDMPDDMWEKIRNNRELTGEAMRIAVRQTKEGIEERIRALTPVSDAEKGACCGNYRESGACCGNYREPNGDKGTA